MGGDHISKIVSKANSTLGFLRRNLKGYLSKLKGIKRAVLYVILTRPADNLVRPN